MNTHKTWARLKNFVGISRNNEGEYKYTFTDHKVRIEARGFDSAEDARSARLAAIKKAGLEVDANERVKFTRGSQSQRPKTKRYQRILKGRYKDGRTYYQVMGTDATTGKQRKFGNYPTLSQAIARRNDLLANKLVTEHDQQHPVEAWKGYDNARVNGIAMPLFKGQVPRVDSKIGYRGVVKIGGYYIGRIVVKGQVYYSSSFDNPRDAYFKGRLALEKQYLPKRPSKTATKPRPNDEMRGIFVEENGTTRTYKVMLEYHGHILHGGFFKRKSVAMKHRNQMIQELDASEREIKQYPERKVLPDPVTGKYIGVFGRKSFYVSQLNTGSTAKYLGTYMTPLGAGLARQRYAVERGIYLDQYGRQFRKTAEEKTISRNKPHQPQPYPDLPPNVYEGLTESGRRYLKIYFDGVFQPGRFNSVGAAVRQLKHLHKQFK